MKKRTASQAEESYSSGFSKPSPARPTPNESCPVCGKPLIQEKCKVVCRSALCGYRIVYNCSEF